MSHRFSNSLQTRLFVRALAGQPSFKSWNTIPYNLRLLIMLHIQDVIEEVLNEEI